MKLTMQDQWVVILHEEELQLLVQFESWEMIENTNTFTFFNKFKLPVAPFTNMV